ncbi:MAG: DMT family transporter [Polyangiaceae bacterium]
MSERAPAKAYSWMIASSFLFAVMNVCARTTSGHIDWKMVAFTRAGTGTLIAILVGKMRGGRIFPRSTPAMWGRSFFGTGALTCTFWVLSSRELALGDAATLLNLAPVLLAFLGPLVLGERSGRRVFLALPLAFAGVVLVLHPPLLFGATAAGGATLRVAAVALVSSCFSACAMLMLRRVGPTESAESIVAHFSATAFVALAIVTLPTATLPNLNELVVMLIAGVSGGLAQIAMTRAYALEFAARVSPFGYLIIVFTAALGAALLHDWPKPLALSGMALVLAAGVVVTFASLREERRERRAADATLRP